MERVYVGQPGEAIQDRSQLLGYRFLSELDFSRIEGAYATDLKACSDLRR